MKCCQSEKLFKGDYVTLREGTREMSKESNFLIYCMERYRHFKGLSGAGYITKYFDSLHIMGDRCIVQDIDDYISSNTGNSLGRV